MIDHDDIDDMRARALARRESDAKIPTPAELMEARRHREAPTEEEVQRNIDSVTRQLRETWPPAAHTHGSAALLREVARRLTARGWACHHSKAQQVLQVTAPPVLHGSDR